MPMPALAPEEREEGCGEGRAGGVVVEVGLERSWVNEEEAAGVVVAAAMELEGVAAADAGELWTLVKIMG